MVYLFLIVLAQLLQQGLHLYFHFPCHNFLHSYLLGLLIDEWEVIGGYRYRRTAQAFPILRIILRSFLILFFLRSNRPFAPCFFFLLGWDVLPLTGFNKILYVFSAPL